MAFRLWDFVKTYADTLFVVAHESGASTGASPLQASGGLIK